MIWSLYYCPNFLQEKFEWNLFLTSCQLLTYIFYVYWNFSYLGINVGMNVGINSDTSYFLSSHYYIGNKNAMLDGTVISQREPITSRE